MQLRKRISDAKILLFLDNLSRRKPLTPEGEASSFQRCLTILDLVVMGVSSTLGCGVYLLTGDVIRVVAGPSTIISYLIAAVTSSLTALCFAEFGTRVPKAGSAYLYSYVVMGEMWAFITAWTALMSFIIGTSSLAKAWSAVFDEVIGNVFSNTLGKQTALHLPGFALYPDFFAAGIIMILAGLLTFGIKEVASVHTVLLTADFLVLLFVILSGFIKGNINNWYISEDFIKNNTSLNGTTSYGSGGFFPFGFNGTLAGAAACFLGYNGIDCIAQIGEHAQNPRRSIPVSIVVTQLICFLSYLGVSAAMSAMMPYYLLSAKNPLSETFTYVGWGPAKYVVSVAALCAMLTSLIGTVIPMSQLLFAMSRDGLLFRSLSKLNNRQSPFIAIIVSSIAAAIMALLFDLTALIGMMALGTILFYTLVAICILIIRYEADFSEDSTLSKTEPFTLNAVINPPPQCTPQTSKNVSVLTGFVFILAFILSVFIKEAADSPQALQLWSLLSILVISLILIFIVLIIWRQPQNTTKAAFMVPFVPMVPIVTTIVNVYLLVQLGLEAWIYYGVWMVVGLIFYFTYGVQHSVHKQWLQDAHSTPTVLEKSFKP